MSRVGEETHNGFSDKVTITVLEENGLDFSDNLLLPLLSDWLCKTYLSIDTSRPVKIHLKAAAEVPEVGVLLTALRIFSVEMEITLHCAKISSENEYALRKLCKCLGVFRSTAEEKSSLDTVIGIEQSQTILQLIRPFLRRLFAEVQYELNIFNQRDYQALLDRTPVRPRSLERLDYVLNSDGLCEFSKFFHLERGSCCDSGCKNCPF